MRTITSKNSCVGSGIGSDNEIKLDHDRQQPTSRCSPKDTLINQIPSNAEACDGPDHFLIYIFYSPRTVPIQSIASRNGNKINRLKRFAIHSFEADYVLESVRSLSPENTSFKSKLKHTKKNAHTLSELDSDESAESQALIP